VWSQINRDNVARLTKAGRMTPHGQRHVDAAKADGRWDAAYARIRTASVDSLPKDLRAAIAANAKPEEFFHTLSRPNVSALGYRANAIKTAAGRTRKIADLVRKL
jgi:uncharacterized protein YdeI (YjbR/CyaY-like superfamily)